MSSHTPAPIFASTGPEAAETILPFSDEAEREARRSRVLSLDLDLSRSEFAALPEVDVPRMRLDRLERLQGELRKRDVGGIVLYAPVNIRYATDCRNMQAPCAPAQVIAKHLLAWLVDSDHRRRHKVGFC